MLLHEGSSVWIPQSKYSWRPAIFLKTLPDKNNLYLRWLDTNEEEAFNLNTIYDKKLLLFDCQYGCPSQIDLSSLDIINEPEVLHNLRTRFCNQLEIYTYCGTLLIVLNPYEYLPIYGLDYMSAYNQSSIDSETRRDPHIFAIADEAFSRMKLLKQNQSIIISGESGAGKTVSAKHVLQYLALMTSTRLCSGMALADDAASISMRVIASSPILESLGNAMTTRNGNSSRFGKFLEVGFSQIPCRLDRACIRTYLLEKSRVVLQNENERNYHIFYQLLAAANCETSRKDNPFLEELRLMRSVTYHYAKWSEVTKSDLADFAITLESLKNLGFSANEVDMVFTILAAVLHLGNTSYTEAPNEGSKVTKEGNIALSEAFRLLQCDFQFDSLIEAERCLCHRIIYTTGGELLKPLSTSEAVSARDALAKFLHQLLFNWIVMRCNESLDACSERKSSDNFIGILDIYGFETLDVNSFEQFCINYANEKLQQRFIKNVFQLEQEEYEREGLVWSFVEYYDNTPCVELLEGPLGVIELLKDECKLPKPRDCNWLARVCQEHLGRSPDFSQSKLWSRERFIIQHFSEKVEYAVEGFVKKNLDRIIPEHADLLTHTKNPILRQMIENFRATNVAEAKHQGILTKPAVLTQFSTSLKTLLGILNRTSSHYVRCIKPNDNKAAFTFCPERVMQQLRACGVLQTIKISAAGYPSRWTYEDFLARYWQLRPSSHLLDEDAKDITENILRNCLMDPNKYRLGKTKIFIGNGILAQLERARRARIIEATITIQKYAQAWLVRRRYRQTRQLIITLQAFSRRWLAQNRMRQLLGSRKKEARYEPKPEKLKSYVRSKVHQSKKESIRALKIEIDRLRSQLASRDKEVDLKELQIAELLTEQDKVKKTARKKRDKSERHRIQTNIDSSAYYEEVENLPRRKSQPNLHRVAPDSVHGTAFGVERAVETECLPNDTMDLLMDLQQRCACLDAEKEDLYEKLEMYQKNYAIAQARKLEAKKFANRVAGQIDVQAQEKIIVETHQRGAQTDDTDLELLLKSRSKLEADKGKSTLVKHAEEPRLLQEGQTHSFSKDVLEQDDLGNGVSRLTRENLQLRNQLSTANTFNRQLTSATKYYAELVHRQSPDYLQMTTSPYLLDVRQLIAVSQSRVDAKGLHDFTVKPRLIRCLEGKEEALVCCLVKNLNVRVAKSWLSPIVAELLFLLLCGADAMHDQHQISALLTSTIRSVQSVLNKHSSTMETTLFWLVNIFVLRNCIQLSSGNKEKTSNGDEAKYELLNHDVTPFVPLLNDVITLSFHILMSQVIDVVFPPNLITGALLEYQPIPSLISQSLTVPRTGGLRPESTWLLRKPHFKRFMNNLDKIYDLLTALHADFSLVWYIFYRITYYICSSALNSILLRGDLCNWARGAQIRQNLATLEIWFSDRDLIPEMSQSEVYRGNRHLKDLLLPLIQVCHVLQSKKGGSNNTQISSICQLCPNLTSAQILRLLSRCTRVNGLEEAIQPEFLAAVRRRVREQRSQGNAKTICCGIEVSQKTILLDCEQWDASKEILPFVPLPTSLSDFQMPLDLEGLSEFIIPVQM